jgi:hypothetical protein
VQPRHPALSSVESEQIADSEALALHAAAYNGMPDPVFHLVERAIGIVTGLGAVEPDPRAGESDMLLDTALRAATALAQLLQARHGFTTAETAAQRDATTAALISAGEQRSSRSPADCCTAVHATRPATDGSQKSSGRDAAPDITPRSGSGPLRSRVVGRASSQITNESKWSEEATRLHNHRLPFAALGPHGPE